MPDGSLDPLSSMTPDQLRMAAAADAELADIKQREVDRLRSRALEMLQRAARLERAR